MKTFLGVLMVIIVSGDNETIKQSVRLGDSVSLQCNCSERNMDMEFQWQMEEPNMSLVFKHDKTIPTFYGSYEGRAETFLSDNSNNCSLLLTNITANDQGIYKCSWYIQDTYQRSFVNLSVSADYHVCQKDNNPSGSSKVFQCNVTGRYRETKIHWKLDGQLLTNSATTYITNTDPQDAGTGYFHFNSTLSTKRNWTSKPTCDVEAKGISTNIANCESVLSTLEHDPPPTRSRHITIIPIMLVLGLSLFLWRRRSNTSPSSLRTRGMETDDLYC